MAEAAGADIVDLNFGCPAKEVTGSASGSALMRTPDLASRIMAATVAATSRPVTVKMRLGWDDGSRNAADLAARAREAGVAMVVIHGRTRAQFYTGRADWAAIAPVRAALPGVTLIANGDVTDAAAARAAMAASGADAVMVGRAAQGQPWLPAQIAAALEGRAVPPAPQGAARADLIAGHYTEMLGFYGRDLGARVARKHLGWYAEAARSPRRAERVQAETPAATLALIARAFAEAPHPAQEAA